MFDARIMSINVVCAKRKSCHLPVDILLIESALIRVYLPQNEAVETEKGCEYSRRNLNFHMHI